MNVLCCFPTTERVVGRQLVHLLQYEHLPRYHPVLCPAASWEKTHHLLLLRSRHLHNVSPRAHSHECQRSLAGINSVMNPFFCFLPASLRVRCKQNKYPILFLTQGISVMYPELMDIRCQTTQIAISFAQSENILVSFVALKSRICQFGTQLMEQEVCSCSCGETVRGVDDYVGKWIQCLELVGLSAVSKYNNLTKFIRASKWIEIQDYMKRDCISCGRRFRASAATLRSCWRISPTLEMPSRKAWWFSAGELTTMTTRTEGSWESKASTGSSMIGGLMFQASLAPLSHCLYAWAVISSYYYSWKRWYTC